MFYFSKAAMQPLSALLAALTLTPAQAQTQPPTPAAETRVAMRADPTDPRAATPALAYPSSLARYQRFTEPDVAPWRETNDLVRQRGGWRAYAREAGEPASPAAAVAPIAPAAPAASQPAASVKPAMPGHAGHGMK